MFATIHFADLYPKGPQFSLLAKLGYLPEIYFESGWERIPKEAHRRLAGIVQDALGGCSVHLPYRDMLPGSGDPKAGETLRRAASIAALYAPAHMVGHPCFRAIRDAEGAPLKHLALGKGGKIGLKGQSAIPGEAFLAHSRSSWKGVLEECDAPLYLENTIERSPWPIMRILEGLPEGRAGMCLDVGHWHYSGMGAEFGNLSEWVGLCAGRLGHLHLHDNDGSADQHLAMGDGLIDFARLWDLLRERGLDPSATIENAAPAELSASAAFMERHPFK
jgi:sugar phosphate isomerase/epimerase